MLMATPGNLHRIEMAVEAAIGRDREISGEEYEQLADMLDEVHQIVAYEKEIH